VRLVCLAADLSNGISQQTPGGRIPGPLPTILVSIRKGIAAAAGARMEDVAILCPPETFSQPTPEDRAAVPPPAHN